MNLGDRLYASAPWVPPLAYYPRTRLADYVGTVLRQYYLHAQWHARFVGATSYGYNLRAVAEDTETVNRAFASTDWVGVHRGHRTLPRETSHVTAHVLYSILNDRPVQVHLRLDVDDGTDIDTHEIHDIRSQYTIPRVDQLRNNNARILRAENPFSARWALYLQQVSVELADVDSAQPGRCAVPAFAYATDEDSGAARLMLPLYVAVYAETRYSDG